MTRVKRSTTAVRREPRRGRANLNQRKRWLGASPRCRGSRSADLFPNGKSSLPLCVHHAQIGLPRPDISDQPGLEIDVMEPPALSMSIRIIPADSRRTCAANPSSSPERPARLARVSMTVWRARFSPALFKPDAAQPAASTSPASRATTLSCPRRRASGKPNVHRANPRSVPARTRASPWPSPGCAPCPGRVPLPNVRPGVPPGQGRLTGQETGHATTGTRTGRRRRARRFARSCPRGDAAHRQ
jgi:hypothetical protein